MNMFETAKLVLICSLFFEGVETEYDDIQPSNDVAILDKNSTSIISDDIDKLYPQTKWYVDYEYKTTYTVSEGGNYYFKTYYEKISEDEEKLEINETKGKIEYAIDPETFKFKSTFLKLDEEGIEDKDVEPDYGHCIPLYQKED